MTKKTDIQKPDKKGQIVKYHSPLPDEDPNQEYIVTEIHLDTDNPRAHIKPVNIKLTLPPKYVVSVDDLTVVS